MWFNSVLRADGEKITVGADTNIQDLALCHVDPGRPLVIGERVTIGHGAILRGCTIEDDVIVGAGCVRRLTHARLSKNWNVSSISIYSPACQCSPSCACVRAEPQ